MDDPVNVGLTLGLSLSVIGPLLVLKSAHQMDVFLSKKSVEFSALVSTAFLPLTVILILILGVIREGPDNGAIRALILMLIVVAIVGWPIAFFVARRALKASRARDKSNSNHPQ